jgi:hypothetical protein
MKKILVILALSATIAHAASSPDEVKAYLLSKLKGINAASESFVKNSAEYAALVKTHGSVAAAAKADLSKVEGLVAAMREDYKGMDSFGYETIEGIVAGVPSLAHYDITLDAGVPASAGPDDVADVVLTLDNGEKIDKQGALFTYIIEPALWGGNADWCVKVGDKMFPRPEVLTAAAAETNKQLISLSKDAAAWQPSVADCFGALIVMTPTLSDYFEDWKESRYSDEKSGRFQAVSRISDMKGIMSSCAVMYGAVEASIAEKDKALAKSAALGFQEILSFLDTLAAREKAGTIQAAEIDELARQAKEKTDKLVPQIEQGAALVGVQPTA